MMFEEKRLSSSTLFKTVIFAGVLCLLIIYRGSGSKPEAPKQISLEQTQSEQSNVRQIEITQESSQQSIENTPSTETAQITPAPSSNNTIGDLITGSIDSNQTANSSIGQIVEQQNAEPQPAPQQVEANAVADVESETSLSQITVKSGDTLYSIARKTGVSVAALTKANGIKKNIIRVGQVLRIPR